MVDLTGRKHQISLDPMTTLQLALGIVNEIHIMYVDAELVIRLSTTYKGNEEVIGQLKRCYEGLRPNHITQGEQNER